MKTIVFQSFRTADVPAWTQSCLDSVRDWAENRNFDYLFLDDGFFDCLPDWYRARVKEEKCLLSDLARLITARQLLDRGYERTIWVDADVIVFNPANFTIPIISGFAFCREVWLGRGGWRKTPATQNVNNAVSVFTRSAREFLDFYINACYTIVRDKQGIPYKTDVGTAFLTGLSPIMKFSLLTNVGLFSPPVMQGIVVENRTVMSRYMEAFGYPISAANLCGSFRGDVVDKVPMSDELYQKAIDKLVSTSGGILKLRGGWSGWSLGFPTKFSK